MLKSCGTLLTLLSAASAYERLAKVKSPTAPISWAFFRCLAGNAAGRWAEAELNIFGLANLSEVNFELDDFMALLPGKLIRLSFEIETR
jgi:hypothetical protein